jgi:hypothetical protein
MDRMNLSQTRYETGAALTVLKVVRRSERLLDRLQKGGSSWKKDRGINLSERGGKQQASAFSMSFLQAWEIYPSDAQRKTGGRVGPNSRRSSVRMSLQLAIPGGVLSSSARFRLTSRAQNALKWSCWSIHFQRTANSVLTVCVSRGDNPNYVSTS